MLNLSLYDLNHNILDTNYLFPHRFCIEGFSFNKKTVKTLDLCILLNALSSGTIPDTGGTSPTLTVTNGAAIVTSFPFTEVFTLTIYLYAVRKTEKEIGNEERYYNKNLRKGTLFVQFKSMPLIVRIFKSVINYW